MPSRSDSLTLIGLDIEGPWNIPLLVNAAELSSASLLLAYRDGVEPSSPNTSTARQRIASLGDLRGQFDRLLACEPGKRARSLYDYPAPRGRTALVVGNELHGIPKADLASADATVSIPMRPSQLTSVNVAVAAAVGLYVLTKDLARQSARMSRLGQFQVDVLLYGADDPSELGSLLRSVWAFGWRRVFLDDLAGVWYGADRGTILASRAAARREANPLAVLPATQLVLEHYDAVIVCDLDSAGTPLSRFRLPPANRVLVMFGAGEAPHKDGRVAPHYVHVDYANRHVRPAYRHAGSTLLSQLGHQLKGPPSRG